MTRRSEYYVYLDSDAWKEKRAAVMRRANGTCEHCGELAVSVHHVKYPKSLGTEPLSDLVATCQRCHDLNHGKRDMQLLSHAKQIERTSASGLSFRCLDVNGKVFATSKSWARALGWPDSDMAHFDVLLENACRLNPTWCGNYQGQSVYRWHPVDDSLIVFSSEYEKHGFKKRTLLETAQFDNLYSNFRAIRNWGRDLQEAAISGSVAAGTAISPTASPTELIALALQQLAPQVQSHEVKLIEHDEQIASLQRSRPIERDPMGWVTVKAAIAELGLDASVLPIPGLKWNLAQVAGQRLVECGSELGTPVSARLDASSRVFPVNTYRRTAVYDVLLALVKASTEH
jgi:hypothetical protein